MRVLVLCASSGITEANVALAGCLVTSVCDQESRGWAGRHIVGDAEEYLRELQREFDARRRRLNIARGGEWFLLQVLMRVGLFRLRRFDRCLAHPSCKVIGQMGNCRAPSKRDIQRALVLPRALMKSTCFEDVYMENPFGSASKLTAAVGKPDMEVQPWWYGNLRDPRNAFTKRTGIWAGTHNVSTAEAPARENWGGQQARIRRAAEFMDLFGPGQKEREFAREATPPGLSAALARHLLCA